MSFVIRPVEESDLTQMYELASQFTLLNLPANKSVLLEKIQRSVESFAGKRKKANEAEYIFVLEDLERKKVVGSSLILAKHGTKKVPHYSFLVLKKNRFSEDLGIGFIHQILRFKEDTDGPTEIGGLLIDRNYRGRPERLGKQMSLVRFLYLALHPERFESRILCELTPPLTEDGRSEFWEALGRRFTGLPYAEADALSQKNKEFIKTLFPEEDIYLALLDAKARMSLGRVGADTMPAKHLLESIGFSYTNEVDPFDGGPHYGAFVQDISIVKNTKEAVVGETSKAHFGLNALVCTDKSKPFRATLSAYELLGDHIHLNELTMKNLKLQTGDKVLYSPIE